MFSKDVLVERLSLVVLMSHLIESCKVVHNRHRDGTVVGLVVLGLSSDTLQRLLIMTLRTYAKHCVLPGNRAESAFSHTSNGEHYCIQDTGGIEFISYGHCLGTYPTIKAFQFAQ